MSDVKLSGAHGRGDEPLADLLARLLGAVPGLVWCEPTPTQKRVTGFQGLWRPPFTGLVPFLSEGAAARIEEARLFWTRGAAHLVAHGDGVRWSAFWEGEGPAWRSNLGTETGRVNGEYQRVDRDVLTKRDVDRYWGSGHLPDWPSDLSVVEYRQGTRLVFWRMEEAKR